MRPALPATPPLPPAKVLKRITSDYKLKLLIAASKPTPLIAEPPNCCRRPTMTHPYFPRDIDLPGYVPMLLDFELILAVFFASVAVVFGVTWLVSGAVPGACRLLAHWGC